jgi:hypothetical protein
MDRDNLYSDVTANPSGAPEAGGATTRYSMFGGNSLLARFLRLVARISRDLEATAYRRLRELEIRRTSGQPSDDPGAPKRARAAAHLPDEPHMKPI